jgi:hypothetical protein
MATLVRANAVKTTIIATPNTTAMHHHGLAIYWVTALHVSNAMLMQKNASSKILKNMTVIAISVRSDGSSHE